MGKKKLHSDSNQPDTAGQKGHHSKARHTVNVDLSKRSGLECYYFLWKSCDYYEQKQTLRDFYSSVVSRHSEDKIGRSHSEGWVHPLCRDLKTDSLCSFTDRLCRSILWLCTEDPTITDLASSPQAYVISLHTKTFSPPWSLQICCGLLYLRTALLKERRTVSGLLFVERQQKVMRRLKPSIQWWIMNLYLINLWLPSRCHK